LRPPPATTGLIIKVSSSSSPSAISDRTSDGLAGRTDRSRRPAGAVPQRTRRHRPLHQRGVRPLIHRIEGAGGDVLRRAVDPARERLVGRVRPVPGPLSERHPAEHTTASCSSAACATTPRPSPHRSWAATRWVPRPQPSIELNSPAVTLRMRSIPSCSPEWSTGRVWQASLGGKWSVDRSNCCRISESNRRPGRGLDSFGAWIWRWSSSLGCPAPPAA